MEYLAILQKNSSVISLGRLDSKDHHISRLPISGGRVNDLETLLRSQHTEKVKAFVPPVRGAGIWGEFYPPIRSIHVANQLVAIPLLDIEGQAD